MVQYARPQADIVDGAWLNESGSAVSLYASIDEDVSAPNDADYIQSESAPVASACAVDLSTIEDPVSSAGHTLRWRRGKNAAGGAQIDLTVQLRQGYTNEGSQGTLIKTVADANIPDAATTTTSALSGAEADSITDYSDLQMRFVANQV